MPSGLQKKGLLAEIKNQIQTQVKIIKEGGTVSADEKSITVNNANVVTLYISIASSIKNYKLQYFTRISPKKEYLNYEIDLEDI